MKKFIKYFLIIMVGILCFMFTINYIKADSGWDSSYDWGSSWDSGSDWGSSWDTDWDTDWDYGYSGSYSDNGIENGTALLILVIVVIIIVIICTISSNNAGRIPTIGEVPEYEYTPVSEEEIKKIIPDFNKTLFISDAYQIFLDIQKAWSNFDTKTLRKLLSDELYNTYNMQLKVLKSKKQKNIMTDFILNEIDVSGIEVSGDKITLEVVLKTNFYDYVVDENNNVVRGTKNKKMHITYLLTFISTINQKETKVCPSCGAPISKNSQSEVCEYCKSVLVKNTYNWVLAKKENKRQD